jgi:outer membrane protein OmpA-like peptidoglycan-associated protein
MKKLCITGTLLFALAGMMACQAQSGPNKNVMERPVEVDNIDYKKQSEAWKNAWSTKKKELDKMRVLANKSEAERKRLGKEVDRLEREARDYFQQWQKSEEMYVEAAGERDDLAIKLSKSREDLTTARTIIAIQDSIIAAKDNIIVYLQAELGRLKQVREDHLDTEGNSISIGLISTTYKKAGEVAGFAPNSDKMPNLSSNDLDYLERLASLLRRHNMKIELVGNCKYEDMNEGAARSLAQRRAASVREFLTNNYGLRSDLIEVSGTTRCDVCNTVKIRVKD